MLLVGEERREGLVGVGRGILHHGRSEREVLGAEIDPQREGSRDAALRLAQRAHGENLHAVDGEADPPPPAREEAGLGLRGPGRAAVDGDVTIALRANGLGGRGGRVLLVGHGTLLVAMGSTNPMA